MKFALFLMLLLAVALQPDSAFAKKRKKKKSKVNPDIKCTLDYISNGNSNSVDIRLAKANIRMDGKSKSVKIDEQTGDNICNEVSQILWRQLIKAEKEKDCNSKTKVYVREKRHSICVDNLEEDENFKKMLALLANP